jgi:hypothetical protein
VGFNGNAPRKKGRADTKKAGTATIKATDPATGIFGTTSVTVTSATLQSISVTPASPQIAKGTTLQFHATGTYTGGIQIDISSIVSWSSSAPGVAGITSSNTSQGYATGVAAGTSTITATMSGTTPLISGSTTLTVSNATLQSITVTPANGSMNHGTTQQMTATGHFNDTTTQDLTLQVTWTTSNTAIAVVSNQAGLKGIATGIAAGGPVTVTAAFPVSTIKGTTNLTVN